MDPSNQVEYAFRMANYANALYQGRYAQLMILGQTNHPRFKEELVTETSRVLKRFVTLFEVVYKGGAVFDDNGMPASKVASEIKTFLVNLKPEIMGLANESKRILISDDYYLRPEDVSMLIAVHARVVYSQENFMKNMADYKERVAELEEARLIRERVEKLGESVSEVNDFLRLFKDPAAKFHNHLRFKARLGPGMFRSAHHDILQFEHGAVEPFTYPKAGFLSVEAKAWESAGYDPLDAGYWRAFGFSTEDAITWAEAGIRDPVISAEWRTAGFKAEDAVGWISVLFPPLLAIQWLNAGFSPKDSAVLISQGYSMPDEVPEGKAPELIAAGLERWGGQ